jgi:hypothetical protein
MSNTDITRRGAPVAAALLMALVLAACGGGGGNPGSAGGGSGSTGGSGGTGGTGGTGGGGGGTGTVPAAAPASVQFVTASPADKSIVIKGQGGTGRSETATLTFRVVDVNGNPLANQAVSFTLLTPGDASLNTKDGKTAADGTVVATVNSGSAPATFRVQAAVTGASGAALTSLSDTITVSTGLPVQNSFSIGADTFNVEGLDINSSPDKPAAHIQVMLADAFGNPVSDGTPVIFQTNAGSVGSSSRGGCTTVNGACTVDFRAQNPRTPIPGQPETPCNTTGTDGKGANIAPDIIRPGLATICASSTGGTSTLLGRTMIFLSGSTVQHVYLDSVANELDLLNGPASVGTFEAGKAKTVWLQLNDANRNPMPAGTTVAVTNPQGVTAGAVLPATVPSVPLNAPITRDRTGTGGYSQGSWHQIVLTPTAPANCTGTQEASFTLTVTTPGVSSTPGSAAGPTTTNIPFKLSITCP